MPTTVFDLLDREWDELARSSGATAAMEQWARDEPCLAPFSSLTELARFTATACPESVDKVLAALARHAPTDLFAARVLLQLLLPGCRAVARRLTVHDDDADERAAAVVAAAYGRIRTYPAERRPVAIAPNVVRDTAKWARRALQSGASRPGERATLDELDELPTADVALPADELLAVLLEAVRRGIIDHDTAKVVALTRIGGHSIERLAAQRRCHPGSLRRRRQAAEAALGAVA